MRESNSFLYLVQAVVPVMYMVDLATIGIVVNVVLSLLTAFLGYKLFSAWLSASSDKEKQALTSLVSGFCYLLAAKIIVDAVPLENYWASAGLNFTLASMIVNTLFVVGLVYLLVATTSVLRKGKK